ncbi:MAG: 50S ribosomal protein L11 methyltransferase [Acidobacteriota bacterium]
MTAERYLCVEIPLSPEERERVTELLWELDSIGFEELEAPEGPRILAYFEATRDAEPIRGRLRSALADGQAAIEIHEIRYDSSRWLENYNRTFTAFEINPTFWIYPPWGKPSIDHPVNIQLEPGHGFGTGTHESTQLALAAMEDALPECRSMTDVGTGSGILSAAASLLCPGLRVTAFDRDPLAISAARQTFLRNGLGDISLFTGEIAALQGPFDLVVANLTATILIALSEDLIRKTGKCLVASGFTLDEADRVKESLEEGNALQCREQWTKNGWACWLLRRCDES